MNTTKTIRTLSTFIVTAILSTGCLAADGEECTEANADDIDCVTDTTGEAAPALVECVDCFDDGETPEPSPVVDAPRADAPSSWPTGSYFGAPCGERDYDRMLYVHAEGELVLDDHVAPCPEGVNCAWSGVVRRTGTYAVDNGIAPAATRTVFAAWDEANGGDEAALPAPNAFSGTPWSDELTESKTGCIYRRLEIVFPN